MDSNIPIVTSDGKPTQEFIAEINSMRAPGDPWLNANVVIADKAGKPTRYLMQTFRKMFGVVPNANVAIVDDQQCPTRPFILLVRT